MHLLVSCPKCKQQLKITQESVGKPVKCPCGTVFVTQGGPAKAPAPAVPPAAPRAEPPKPTAAPPAAAPPKPPAPAAAPTILTACPHCQQQLRVAETARGQQVKCPKCARVFPVAAAATSAVAAKPAPAPAATTPSQAAAPRPPAPPSEADLLAGEELGDADIMEPPPRPAAKKAASQAVAARPPIPLPADDALADEVLEGAPWEPAPVQPKPPRQKRLDRVALSVAGVVGVYLVVLAVVASGIFDGKPATPSSPSKDNTKKSLDVAYIASNFNAAAVIHPRRMLKSKVLAELPQDKLFEGLVKNIGVDPRQVEQVMLLFEPYAKSIEPYSAAGSAVIVRFAEVVEGKQLLTRILGGVTEATSNDKPIYKSKTQKVGNSPLAGYVANDRTLLIAPEPMLAKMLLAVGAKSPLIEGLRQVDANTDAVFVFDLDADQKSLGKETIRHTATEYLSRYKKALPEKLAEVATLPERLKLATVTLNLTGDTLLKVVLDINSTDSAKVVHDLVENGLVIAKQFWVVDGKEMLRKAAPDLPAPELAKSLDKMGDELIDGLTLTKEASQVMLSVKTPRGLPQIVGQLAPLIQEALNPPPPKKPMREQAVDWVRENNRFGPTHKLVKDTAQMLAKQAAQDGFFLQLGSGLVKSGKQTILCGWGGELFVFELNTEQEKKYPLTAQVIVTEAVGGNDRVPSARPEVDLSALKIDNVHNLDPAKALAGSVVFKRRKTSPVFYALRLVFLNGKVTALFPIADWPPKGKDVLPFSFLSLNESGVKGPKVLPAVLEMVTHTDIARERKPTVVSNPVAVLITVK